MKSHPMWRGMVRIAAGAALWVAVAGPARLSAQDEPLIRPGDLILGLSQTDPALSIEHARGPAVENGGEFAEEIWLTAFMQSMELDNLNGISHNPEGNLLGVNFGSSANGGTIHNLATLERDLPDQLIGNTTGLGGEGLTLSRLGGLSIAPDNSKIAVTGYDTGQVYVFDYTAGNGLAAGASLSGGRQTSPVFGPFDTHGSAWLDSERVILLNTEGNLVQVNATTLESSILAQVATGGGPTVTRSEFTDIEFNQTVSPYIYATYGAFNADGIDGPNPNLNRLYVFDPRDNFSLVKEVDLSARDAENNPLTDSLREIALTPEGNLLLGQFRAGGVDLLLNVVEPASLADNSAIDWYTPITTTASFSGLDVAIGLPLDTGVRGDFDQNGVLDANDINLLSAEVKAGTNLPEYDLNDDQFVNDADRDIWVEELKFTYYGDATLDGQFSTDDMVTVFQAGEYEDGVEGNSLWQTGDWTGDMEFDTSDMVLAFQKGGFELGPRAAVASVPEPSAAWLLALGLLAFVRRP